MSTTSDDQPAVAEDRARQGVEHLQAAARELIEAARAALDVAEDLVNDPERAAALVGSLADAGDIARRVVRAGGRATADGPDGEPRVERISVT
jgi:hypothetical protein